jgi:hypothetical protein
MGITVSAVVFLEFNSLDRDHLIPNDPKAIKASSFLLSANGSMIVRAPGAPESDPVFTATGTFEISFQKFGDSAYQFAVSLTNVQLLIGSGDSSKALFAFTANGLFVARTGARKGVAGTLTVTLRANLPSALNAEITSASNPALPASFTLRFNTFGASVSYTNAAGQTQTISGTPPGGASAAPYLYISANGSLRVWTPTLAAAKTGPPALIISGSFDFVAAGGMITLKGTGNAALLGKAFTLQMDVQVYTGANPGLVARLQPAIDLQLGIARLRGSGELLINTRSVFGEAGGVNIAARTLALKVNGGPRGGTPLISIAGLKIYGSASFLITPGRVDFEASAAVDLYIMQLSGTASGFFKTLEDGTLKFDVGGTLGFRLGSDPDDDFATYVEGEVEVHATDAGAITGSFAGSGAVAGVVIGTIRGNLGADGILSVSGTAFDIPYETEFLLPGASGETPLKIGLFAAGGATNSVFVTEGADSELQFSIKLSKALPIATIITLEIHNQTALLNDDWSVITAGSSSTGSAAFTAKYTILPGQLQTSIRLRIINDSNHEPEETFLIRMANTGGVAISNADLQGVIRDNDLAEAPTPGGAMVYYPLETVVTTSTSSHYEFSDRARIGLGAGSFQLVSVKPSFVFGGEPRITPFVVALEPGEIGFAAAGGEWGGVRTRGFGLVDDFSIILGAQQNVVLGGGLLNPASIRAYQFSITNSSSTPFADVGWIEFDAKSLNGGPERWELHDSINGITGAGLGSGALSNTFDRYYVPVNLAGRTGTVAFWITGEGASSFEGQMVVDNIAVMRKAVVTATPVGSVTETNSNQSVQINLHNFAAEEGLIVGFKVIGVTASGQTDFGVPFNSASFAYPAFGGGFRSIFTNQNSGPLLAFDPNVKNGSAALPGTSGSFNITIIGDQIAEPLEKIRLEFSIIRGAGSVPAPFEISILNDDPATPPSDAVAFFTFETDSGLGTSFAESVASGVTDGSGSAPRVTLETRNISGTTTSTASTASSSGSFGRALSSSGWVSYNNFTLNGRQVQVEDLNYSRSFVFSIAAPPAGFAGTPRISLTELSFVTDDGSGGPTGWVVDVYIGGSSVKRVTGTVTDGYRTVHKVDLTGLGSTGTITFKLTGTGATSATGLWRIDNLLVRGSIGVPVPSSNTSIVKVGTFQSVVSGALVFFDANHNEMFDDGEPFASSNDLGSANLSIPDVAFDQAGGKGYILAVGGTDIIKNVPLQLLLRVPIAKGQKEAVASPLSSLLAILEEFGFDQKFANETLLARLGLPGEIDLRKYAYTGEFKQGNKEAAQVTKISALVGSLTLALSHVFSAADGDALPLENYQHAIMAAIGGIAVSLPPGQRINFTAESTIVAIIENASARAAVGLKSGISQTIAQTITRGFRILSSLEVATTAEILEEIARIQKVIQVELSPVFSDMAAERIAPTEVNRLFAPGTWQGRIDATNVSKIPAELTGAGQIEHAEREVAPGVFEITETYPRSEVRPPSWPSDAAYQFTVAEWSKSPISSASVRIVTYENQTQPSAWLIRWINAKGERIVAGYAMTTPGELVTTVALERLPASWPASFEIVGLGSAFQPAGFSVIKSVAWNAIHGQQVDLSGPSRAREGDSKIIVAVNTSLPSDGLVLGFNVRGVAATAGVDFNLERPAGASSFQLDGNVYSGTMKLDSASSFIFHINQDAEVELAESLEIEIFLVSGAGMLGKSKAVVQIIDDDFAGSIGEASINQGSASRSKVEKIELPFSAEAFASAKDFKVRNLETGAVVIPGVVKTEQTSRIGLNLPALPGDGEYQLEFSLTGRAYSIRFHQLFGDSNGSRTIDVADYIAFSLALNSQAGGDRYNSSLDADGDGDIDSVDAFKFKASAARPTLQTALNHDANGNGFGKQYDLDGDNDVDAADLFQFQHRTDALPIKPLQTGMASEDRANGTRAVSAANSTIATQEAPDPFLKKTPSPAASDHEVTVTIRFNTSSWINESTRDQTEELFGSRKLRKTLTPVGNVPRPLPNAPSYSL